MQSWMRANPQNPQSICSHPRLHQTLHGSRITTGLASSNILGFESPNLVPYGCT